MDRSVAASSLPRWIEGTDAAVAPGLDGALVSEAGMLPDAGPTRPTCGCMGQPCCAGACNGMLSCRSSTCMDCFTTDPTIMGTTPTTAMFLTAISAINDTLWISSSDGMSVGQVPFVLTGGATGTGTAVVTQIVGITTTGSAMHVHGPGGSMGTINLAGATLMGSFTAPMHGAVEGAITHASATGHVLTLTAWNGTMGTITFVPVETCR